MQRLQRLPVAEPRRAAAAVEREQALERLQRARMPARFVEQAAQMEQRRPVAPVERERALQARHRIVELAQPRQRQAALAPGVGLRRVERDRAVERLQRGFGLAERQPHGAEVGERRGALGQQCQRGLEARFGRRGVAGLGLRDAVEEQRLCALERRGVVVIHRGVIVDDPERGAAGACASQRPGAHIGQPERLGAAQRAQRHIFFFQRRSPRTPASFMPR
ncbi:MAG: hypothetical protein LKCHEGNO_00476 [Burkholderiaceae bacterium]|nr:hypothetical protein [Burkholderiaceae bacterium]